MWRDVDKHLADIITACSKLPQEIGVRISPVGLRDQERVADLCRQINWVDAVQDPLRPVPQFHIVVKVEESEESVLQFTLIPVQDELEHSLASAERFWIPLSHDGLEGGLLDGFLS